MYLKNYSPGWDNFQSNFIKDTFDLLLSPLTHLLNLSITQGVFPDELKIAKVIPIFKSGDSAQIGNYRHVSVLPFFSKVFERVMYVRLFSFIKNMIYYINISSVSDKVLVQIQHWFS